jgi:hypothetical protein
MVGRKTITHPDPANADWRGKSGGYCFPMRNFLVKKATVGRCL